MSQEPICSLCGSPSLKHKMWSMELKGFVFKNKQIARDVTTRIIKREYDPTLDRHICYCCLCVIEEKLLEAAKEKMEI